MTDLWRVAELVVAVCGGWFCIGVIVALLFGLICRMTSVKRESEVR